MLRFERECRTPNSECYTILDDDQPQGRFDVHFAGNIIHATLVVTERYTQEEIQDPQHLAAKLRRPRRRARRRA